MRDVIARAIDRADLICLHLDPAYAGVAEPVRTAVSKREAARIARLAEPAGGVRLTWEGTRLILSPPGRLNGEAQP
ncbi:hypothetical protein MCBMB27_02600 [Methylobacterium phyllosphaerae]|uniref:Uncharacterized protein n=1 Tax=Methylobacterium phyllosphaerae TaxID=418223 RepID=A0AAE8HSK3_9HYPH|nr:hypothetical protein [Methylobacterium phyllosphaerae]APT31891.1 hypothetical protein MCBMB27_02600 [Methylobacterium phyllosphaerae]SFH02022.1 hypothetical protein SAMN05192567_11267 [Methylobacterium phyllosphaerae]